MEKEERVFSEETKEKVSELRLIDDTLFRKACEDKLFCQEILRTLLDDTKLEVIKVKTQYTYNSFARELVVDALCRLGTGEYCNIEVQKGNKHDDLRRTRFHASMITVGETPKGTNFKDIPDVIVIYISEYDAIGNRKSFTRERRCIENDGVWTPVDDGERIYYANTAVDDGSDKSELLQLFTKKEVSSEKFKELSRVVDYYKNGEGVDIMCQIMEDYRAEGKIEGKKKVAKNLIVLAIASDEKIAEAAEISLEEVKELRQELINAGLLTE